MGWGYGRNAEGREVGYTVEAICDADDCRAEIDRGLAYCCGGMHDGGEEGCGGYFCADHLLLTGCPDATPGHFMCEPCCDRWELEHCNSATLGSR